ncbi:MAG: imm11 family protein [Planctomycetaceae bacterium]
MKYFEIIPDAIEATNGETWLIDLPVTYKVGNVWLGDCQRIPDWDERFIGTYPDTDFIEVDFPDSFHPIVSPRLRGFLEQRLPDAIQYLPIRLQRPDGSGEVVGFSIAQVLVNVDCIDQKRTPVRDGKWRRDPYGNFEILLTSEIRLKWDAIRNHQIFRIDGSSITLVVRQDLKEAIEEGGFSGCAFERMKVTK